MDFYILVFNFWHWQKKQYSALISVCFAEIQKNTNFFEFFCKKSAFFELIYREGKFLTYIRGKTAAQSRRKGLDIKMMHSFQIVENSKGGLRRERRDGTKTGRYLLYRIL